MSELRFMDPFEAMKEVRQSHTVVTDTPNVCDGHFAGYLPGEDRSELLFTFHDEANNGIVALAVPVPPPSEVTSEAEGQRIVDEAHERARTAAELKAFAGLN